MFPDASPWNAPTPNPTTQRTCTRTSIRNRTHGIRGVVTNRLTTAEKNEKGSRRLVPHKRRPQREHCRPQGYQLTVIISETPTHSQKAAAIIGGHQGFEPRQKRWPRPPPRRSCVPPPYNTSISGSPQWVYRCTVDVGIILSSTPRASTHNTSCSLFSSSKRSAAKAASLIDQSRFIADSIIGLDARPLFLPKLKRPNLQANQGSALTIDIQVTRFTLQLPLAPTPFSPCLSAVASSHHLIIPPAVPPNGNLHPQDVSF